MHTHAALPRANPPLPRTCITEHRNVRQKRPHQGSILGFRSGEPSGRAGRSGHPTLAGRMCWLLLPSLQGKQAMSPSRKDEPNWSTSARSRRAGRSVPNGTARSPRGVCPYMLKGVPGSPPPCATLPTSLRMLGKQVAAPHQWVSWVCFPRAWEMHQHQRRQPWVQAGHSLPGVLPLNPPAGRRQRQTQQSAKATIRV